jgi:hypothetical protein
MRAHKMILGAFAVVAITSGCGKSDGTGGSGGTTSSSSSSKSASSSTGSKGTGSGSTTAATGTGGAGGGMLTPCNPVTGDPCNPANNEACDLSNDGSYLCFPDDTNTGALCMPCDANFCQNKFECVPTNAAGDMAECMAFCCTDSDCGGAAGSCAVGAIDGMVGVCGTLDMTDPNAPFLTNPTCTGIPAMAPSMGSCAPPT